MDLSWDVHIAGNTATPATSTGVGKPLPAPAVASKAVGKSHVVPNRTRITYWQRRCQMDPARPELGSWLVVEDGVARCKVCLDLSSVPKTGNLARHGTSKAHCEAVASRLCGGGTPGAPSELLFKAMLDDRIAGKPYRQSVLCAAAEKAANMTWCLGEALRDQERRYLRDVVTVALHQDGQGSKLCVVYSAATALEARTGILGMAKDFGTDASDIAACTVRILKGACTRRLRPPRGASCKSTFDRVLFDKVASCVELFDADNAADEQAAGRMLAGIDGTLPGAFPNIKVQLQDKTHSATRCAGCDNEYLHLLCTNTCEQEDSTEQCRQL